MDETVDSDVTPIPRWKQDYYGPNRLKIIAQHKASKLRNKDKIKVAGAAYYQKNKAKLKAQHKRYAQENAAKVRVRSKEWSFRRLLKTYGLTLEMYERILKRQNGCCAICKKSPEGQRLHFDHDHKTGQFRGLLCARCNWAMGKFEDDPNLLWNVIAYLGSSKGLTVGVFGLPTIAGATLKQKEVA